MVLKKVQILNVMLVALTPEESALPSYEHGVSCLYCIDKTTEKQKLVSVCANHKLLPLNVNAYKI